MQRLPISSAVMNSVTPVVCLSIVAAKSVQIQKETKHELSSHYTWDSRGAYQRFYVILERLAGLIFYEKKLG